MTDEEFERIKTAIEDSVRLGYITLLQGAEMLRKLARVRHEDDRKDRNDGQSQRV
jgi:hypothetical protein